MEIQQVTDACRFGLLSSARSRLMLGCHADVQPRRHRSA
jgi:hypothetical protein